MFVELYFMDYPRSWIRKVQWQTHQSGLGIVHFLLIDVLIDMSDTVLYLYSRQFIISCLYTYNKGVEYVGTLK